MASLTHNLADFFGKLDLHPVLTRARITALRPKVFQNGNLLAQKDAHPQTWDHNGVPYSLKGSLAGIFGNSRNG